MGRRLSQRVRERGRVVNVSALVAMAANCEGPGEIVGFDIVITKDTPAAGVDSGVTTQASSVRAARTGPPRRRVDR